MSDVAPPAPPLPRIPRWFIASLVSLTALLIVLGILRSNASTLRGDEIVTLFWNRESPGVGDLLLTGARGQVSPAPLYYLVDRVVDDAKDRFHYLGLMPSGYFRLPALLFTALLGAASAWLVALRLRRQEAAVSPVAYFLILCGVAAYWFQPKVLTFACLDRPYGLWNGLWLHALALLLARPGDKLALGILLTLLATTATAACFQILAIGIAFYGVHRWEGKAAGGILREGAFLLAAPALVGAYYALRSGSGGSDPRTFESDPLPNLLRFWLVTNLPAWIAAAAAAALILRRPKLREYALPVAAFAVLLMILPLIYTLARLKGYSSPSRQYIWTTTALPLVLFLAALGWTEIRGRRPAAPLAVILAAGLVVALATATFLRPPIQHDARRLACLEPGSPLLDLLQVERPLALAYPDAMGDIERKNIRLLWEWISTRYPDRPQGIRWVVIRDVDGSLVADPPQQGPELNRYDRFP